MAGNPNAITPISQGAAWNPPVDPASLGPDGQPTRDPAQPGTNSPAITSMGWRRMIAKMLNARRF